MKEDIGPVSLILFHRIVSLFPEATLARARRLSSGFFRYPDGSIQLDSPSQVHAVRIDEDLPISLFRSEGKLTDTLTRNLAPFPRQWYSLYYGGDYQRRLGEGRFIAGRGGGTKDWPGDSQLENILFTVWFLRRPGKDVRESFAARLGGSLGSVSSAGLGLEGPLVPVVPNVEFRGKRADIRFDASKAGPHTLMYLVLTVLEFGHEVAPTRSAVFNYDDPLSRRTMIDCLRNTAVSTGGTFGEEEERKWLEQESGGPGPSVVLPLGAGPMATS